MTFDEAINWLERIKSDTPVSGSTRVSRQELEQLLSALRQQEAVTLPDSERKRIFDAGFRACRGMGDNWSHYRGIQALRIFKAAMTNLAREDWRCPHCGGYDAGGAHLYCSGCGRRGEVTIPPASPPAEPVRIL